MIVEKVFPSGYAENREKRRWVNYLKDDTLLSMSMFPFAFVSKDYMFLIKLRLFQILEQYTPNVGKYELLGIVFR